MKRTSNLANVVLQNNGLVPVIDMIELKKNILKLKRTRWCHFSIFGVLCILSVLDFLGRIFGVLSILSVLGILGRIFGVLCILSVLDILGRIFGVLSIFSVLDILGRSQHVLGILRVLGILGSPGALGVLENF
jgi:hypothetical protein